MRLGSSCCVGWSVRVTLQHRPEEHWDIWVTRTSKYLPTHANTDPENRLSTFKARREATGVWSQGPGKVGGGLQVMWGLAGHRKDFSLYSERAEEPLGFEQSGHVTALDFKGSPWLV